MLRCRSGICHFCCAATISAPTDGTTHGFGRRTTMGNNNTGLLDYLAERAHELAEAARDLTGLQARGLLAEAEELMAIRSSIINRGAQLQLPLEVKKAA